MMCEQFHGLVLLCEQQREDAGNGPTSMLVGPEAEELVRQITGCREGTLEDALRMLDAAMNREEPISVSGWLFDKYCQSSDEAKWGENSILLDNFFSCVGAVTKNEKGHYYFRLPPARLVVVIRSTPSWA